MSGTQSNQIAISVHVSKGQEVICDELSHIYLYEGGGIMANAGASVKLLKGDLGRLNVSQIRAAISPDDIHACESRLVSLENTVNKAVEASILPRPCKRFLIFVVQPGFHFT